MLCDRFTEAFLSAYMSYQTDNYWIGLSDTQTQGTYRWISGVPVTYSNWIAAHTGKKRSFKYLISVYKGKFAH